MDPCVRREDSGDCTNQFAPHRHCESRRLPFLSTFQTAARTSAVSRRRSARGVRKTCPRKRKRALGMPGAGRNPWPACNKKRRRQSPQVQPTSGIPRAVVLTLIRDLPGDRLDCPRHLRVRHIADLASAPGCQDHTISRPQRSRSSRANVRVHRIPASRIVTIGRNVPLAEAGCDKQPWFPKKRKRYIFASRA
jgi:hypothetical protein